MNPFKSGPLLCLFVSLYTPGIFAQSAGKTAQRPNIIVMMSDDHAYQAISAYDNNLIQTPNIDKIAAQGALMQKAFVTNSICSPSRAVLLSGQYSHMNGVLGNQTPTAFKEGIKLLPEILRENGYLTSIVGKWHLKSQPKGFDYWNVLPGQGDYYNPQFIKNGKDTVYEGYVTDITADLALAWLEENKDQKKPFFLMMQQKAPHRNWMPALKYLDLFNDRQFDLPPTFFDGYEEKAALQNNGISIANHMTIDQDSKVPADAKSNRWGAPFNKKIYNSGLNRLKPEERRIWEEAYKKEHEEFAQLKSREERIKWQFQRYMEDYLRCVKSVDDNVGKLLQYLDDNGLADNTIIIYTSDQGFFLGEHGLYDKRFMYEEAFRTPMLIRYPDKIRQGRKVDEMALILDIAPTLLDFAGIAIPGEMQGMSMKPLLTGKKVNWRDKIYYHYYDTNFGTTAHYGIRTERYKLIRYYEPVQAWELYDLRKDPLEMKNLYGNPGYSGLAVKLKKELKALQTEFKEEIEK